MPSVGALVSVIMPVFNSAPFLARSIKSVCDQDYNQWELLIIDDCSVDNSLQIAKEFADADPRIKILKTDSNSGVAAARNIGLDHCRGSYVAFLDSDDQWYPNKLSRQVLFSESQRCLISFCAYERVDEQFRRLGVVRPPRLVTYRDMLSANHIPMLTSMYLREPFYNHRFSPVGHEDYVFWTRLIRLAGVAHLVQPAEPLGLYLVRSESVSSQKLRSAWWHWQNLRRDFGLSFFSALNHFFRYIVHTLRRGF
jgi:teichuronic acid biosynthesis glycosyltransferase TuaG